MPKTYSVRKLAGGNADAIGGLVTSRYEKAEMAFGTIPAGSYKAGDTISFADVPSKYIVEARVTAHLAAGVVALDVVPGTNLTDGPLTLALGTGVYTNGTTAGPLLSYVIHYIRGNGVVGTSAGNVGGAAGDLLQVTVSGTALVAADNVSSTGTGPTV